jgi:site-specific DNA recombinase
MKKKPEAVPQSKRTAIYIRVSSPEQAIEGYSIPAQKERLTAYCKAHDWVIADFYIDGGYTGADLKRPGIQKLISEIGSFDVVLVYKLDRLSRSQRDTLYLIEEVFLPNGIDFVSMNESFDTSVPFGRAMIGILSVFAQLEREQIKERTIMGRMERAKNGLFHGGIFFPIGYDYADGKLVVNEYEAAQVRKIYDWYLDGTSPDKIAERLRGDGYTNRYSSWENATSIRSVLTSEVYIGTIHFGSVVVENAHEALVSREVFEKVRELRIKRQELFGDSPFQSKYLLVSMVFCGRCGSRYFVKHNWGGYKKYTCYARANTSRRMAKAESCDNKNWGLEELEDVVCAEVEELFLSPAYLPRLVAKHKEAIRNKPRGESDVIRDKIADLDSQISHIMDLYQSKTIPVDVVSARIGKLYSERTALDEQLNKIEPQGAREEVDEVKLTALIADLGAIWSLNDTAGKRQILQMIIKRIVLDGDSVEIEWSLFD